MESKHHFHESGKYRRRFRGDKTHDSCTKAGTRSQDFKVLCRLIAKFAGCLFYEKSLEIAQMICYNGNTIRDTASVLRRADRKFRVRQHLQAAARRMVDFTVKTACRVKIIIECEKWRASVRERLRTLNGVLQRFMQLRTAFDRGNNPSCKRVAPVLSDSCCRSRQTP